LWFLLTRFFDHQASLIIRQIRQLKIPRPAKERYTTIQPVVAYRQARCPLQRAVSPSLRCCPSNLQRNPSPEGQ